ncbi:MAG: methionine--tRNA ligase subunit beta, partial [Desulfohalobiaceae bacterium]
TGVSRSSDLFPRLEPEKDPSPCPPQKDVAAPEESLAEFSDFQKLDLRIGTILSARTVPRADKLLQLRVDLGETEPRQLVAGVAEHYSPDDLPGRQVVVVANLKPRTIRGVRSQGMVLAVHEKGALRLVVPSQEVTPGSRVS